MFFIESHVIYEYKLIVIHFCFNINNARIRKDTTTRKPCNVVLHLIIVAYHSCECDMLSSHKATFGIWTLWPHNSIEVNYEAIIYEG